MHTGPAPAFRPVESNSWLLLGRRNEFGHLVSRVVNSPAVCCEGFEDLVSGTCPDERLRIGVPCLDPGSDVGFKLGNAAVGGTAQLSGGQFGEPPLHDVQP